MNLNKLKPAWRQYKLEHSLDQLEHEAILALIDGPGTSKLYPLSKISLFNGLLLSLLMICCQGG